MKALLISSFIFFGFNVFAEVDSQMALKQINDKILYSIRDAKNHIDRAKSGLSMSQIELCSSVAKGLQSADLAENETGLKEFKKIRLVRRDSAVFEFLSLDVRNDYDGKITIQTVSLHELTKELKDFSDKNCSQSFSEFKKLGAKVVDSNCSGSVNDSRQDIISDKKVDQVNDMNQVIKSIQK